MTISMIRRMERAEISMIQAIAPKLTNDVPKHGFRAPIVPPIMRVVPPATATIAEMLAAKAVH